MIFLMILAVPAAVHAFMFGRWLMRNGNRTGGFVVYLIAAACIALPIYRYMSAV
ncbi:hypothetical protein [Sporomusa sp.]|uniref:hypothetical protein n=1 Tax=Sporomusa sp. TaxID=2078658 RepID=UPI002BF5D6C8|nr:hypothetical protein [Sporomusa sp.]HWR05775.1 hypothetical protein [Sporomusa sp.]